jgi:signal transduction histidine kinase
MDLVVGKLKHSGDGHREKLRSLSHDIGNPLMVLSATLTFMQSNTTRTAEDNEALQALERASCRVSRLVDELVAILGDESQVPAIPIETIQLEDLSQRIRGQLQATVRGRDIRVTLFKTREAPVSIETYPLLLERVIDNIITNACKYTERGSIIVEVGGTPGYLLLKISDTGRGMGSERLEEVFLRGSPDAKPVVGTSHGLGLSIVVRLLDQMNGRLEIMSNPGLGTTMWLYIPSKITSGRSTHQDESTKEQFQRVVRIRPRP